MTGTENSRAMLAIAADAADAKGAEDLVALDVSGPLPLVDIFLIATGRNERNVGAIADGIEEALLDAGHKRVRREGRREGRWVLLDFGDLVAQSDVAGAARQEVPCQRRVEESRLMRNRDVKDGDYLASLPEPSGYVAK